MAEAVRWGKRGARINTISPGIIVTPLANAELSGSRGEGYRRMIELSPAKRAGTPDEVGTIGALLMGSEGAFITGSDFLVDGGVTASYSMASSRLSEHRRSIGTPAPHRLPRPAQPPPGPEQTRVAESDSRRITGTLTATSDASGGTSLHRSGWPGASPLPDLAGRRSIEAKRQAP